LANLCSDDPSEAVTEGINAVNKLVAATFVAGASHSFDRILYLGAPILARQVRQRHMPELSSAANEKFCYFPRRLGSSLFKL